MWVSSWCPNALCILVLGHFLRSFLGMSPWMRRP
jgi:hypothetical protein